MGAKLDTWVGSTDTERAVSPVIGVLLLVAIVVILAAVIAAFLLGVVGPEEEARAGVSIDVNEETDRIDIEIIATQNADYVNISGTVRDEDAEPIRADNPYIDPTTIDNPPVLEAAWEDGPRDNLSRLQPGDTVRIGDTANSDVAMDEAAEQGTVTAVAVIEEDDIETTVGSNQYDLDWEDF